MPAVTPAEVQIGPSLDENRVGLAAHARESGSVSSAQWPPVRGCPTWSSKPVRPAGTRRCRPRLSARRGPRGARPMPTRLASLAARMTPSPPATIRVSSRDWSDPAGARSRAQVPAVGRSRGAPRGDHKRLIGRPRAARSPSARGGSEHLHRPGDVEQLNDREGEHLERARWRDLWCLWRHRQVVTQ